ncbi:hypothetical protein L6164_034628 [Bauhinia variegata]|uniref:Uncharacterized protein n=1 Tax=Bauhinia variegata TaxID=167791 RepID=A0ACB9KVV2_BAUVA|nr:hypothetical protein L6164_034628 [Bauhinia variegata]
MASFWSLWAILMALIACNFSLSVATRENMHVSSISAAPAVLPGVPVASPTLSPDIEPLFPSPAGPAQSPTDSSLPTIPSSPSPPNPDALATPTSQVAFPPLSSEPASSPTSQASFQSLNSILYVALLVICTVQLHRI